MSKTPTRTIQNALPNALSRNGTPLSVFAGKIRHSLTRDGWKVVRASRVKRLESVLNEIYVDNRRNRQVELLEEARKIVNSL